MAETSSATSSHGLVIRLLGGMAVDAGGMPVPAATWRRRGALQLVVALAQAPGHRLHREVVLDRVWPDSDHEVAGKALYQTLHVARRALEPGLRHAAGSGYLVSQGDVLALGPDIPVLIDVESFEQAAQVARQSGQAVDYSAAIARYTGDLLPELPYEGWLAPRRQSLRDLHLALLAELAACHQAEGEPIRALAVLDRLVTLDPANEDAHVALMRLYAQAGQRQRALRQYQALVERLRQEVDADPSPATTRLYDAIRSQPLRVVESVSQPTAWVTGAGDADGDQTPNMSGPPGVPGSAGPRTNLPASLTSFIGRAHEVATLRSLLPTTRLLTLVGAGGCGKSRLALRIAEAMMPSYRDGIWLVELAALDDPTLVPEVVAAALGVRAEGRRPVVETLVEYLRSRAVLLLIDNCEHVVDDVAALVGTLLRRCPEVRCLTTSREPLRVAGETVWRVPSLSLPGAASADRRTPRSTAVEAALAGEAVQLFVERARTALPAFRLTDQNAEAVARICRDLDGIPLAIELAAARVPVLSVEQIAARLGDRFRLLSLGQRDALPRQRTLRATIDWSYYLLAPDERELLARLAVLAGSWTLEVAEAVCADDDVPAEAVVDVLGRLVDRSLVLAERDGAETRFRLLETMRQYGRDRLIEMGTFTRWRDRQLAHYLVLATRAEPELWGPDQLAWMDRLEADYDNLRAALLWSQLPETSPDGGHERRLAGLELAWRLGWFWYLHGYHTEGYRWLDGALTKLAPLVGNDPSEATARAWVHKWTGVFAWVTGDYERATALYQLSLALFQQLGNDKGMGYAEGQLGLVASYQGDLARAIERSACAVELFRRAGWRWGVAWALRNQAVPLLRQGALGRAEPLLEESLAICRERDDVWGLASTLRSLAELACERHEYHRATAMFEECAQLYARLKDRRGTGLALAGLARAVRAQGEATRAIGLLEESLRLLDELGDHSATANVRRLLAEIRSGKDR